MAHACNPRTQEAETGLSRLHCKFQTNLGYGEPLSKKKKALCRCGRTSSGGRDTEKVSLWQSQQSRNGEGACLLWLCDLYVEVGQISRS